jgi:hypothetical protein
MTPAQIRDHITTQSEAVGVDPAMALGLAELTGFSPNWTDGKRAGIMSLPKDVIADQAAYQANPKAQIDAGLLALSKNIEELGDFAGLVQYTGSPKSALKAYLRTARNRGQAVTEEELAQSIQAIGLDLNPLEEAGKAGLTLAKPQQTQQPEQPEQQPAQAPAQPMQQPMQSEQILPPEPGQALITSSPSQKKRRIDTVFGCDETDGDIPQDLIAYIKRML